jgi:hypothetical protein
MWLKSALVFGDIFMKVAFCLTQLMLPSYCSQILPITKTKFKWDTATSKHVKLLNESGSLNK